MPRESADRIVKSHHHREAADDPQCGGVRRPTADGLRDRGDLFTRASGMKAGLGTSGGIVAMMMTNVTTAITNAAVPKRGLLTRTRMMPSFESARFFSTAASSD